MNNAAVATGPISLDASGLPAVVLMIGPTGSGKTVFAEKMSTRNRVQLVLNSPELKLPKTQRHLDIAPDWNAFDCVCIDEILQYDQESAKAGVERLIAEAKQRNKKVMLLLQHREDINRLGIAFGEEPAILDINYLDNRATLTYKGCALAQEPLRTQGL